MRNKLLLLIFMGSSALGCGAFSSPKLSFKETRIYHCKIDSLTGEMDYALWPMGKTCNYPKIDTIKHNGDSTNIIIGATVPKVSSLANNYFAYRIGQKKENGIFKMCKVSKSSMDIAIHNKNRSIDICLFDSIGIWHCESYRLCL